jgi:hypothetical protein
MKETAEILDVARRQGWTAIDSGRHYKMIPPGGLTADQPRPLIVAKTPSDRRWKANLLADIRRHSAAGVLLADALTGKAPLNGDGNGHHAEK